MASQATQRLVYGYLLFFVWALAGLFLGRSTTVGPVTNVGYLGVVVLGFGPWLVLRRRAKLPRGFLTSFGLGLSYIPFLISLGALLVLVILFFNY